MEGVVGLGTGIEGSGGGGSPGGGSSGCRLTLLVIIPTQLS